MEKRISVVIAAYNEEARIADVLKVVVNHPLIDEIIVVNDGSSDSTSDIIKRFNVALIENQKNMGKTLSIKEGIEIANNDLIMLIDADLIGLDQKSIEKLARPVLDGHVDWSLSMRKNSFGFMKILKLTKVDWLSGERVIPKRLLADPLIWSRPNVGYGLETLMNKSLLKNHKTFRSIYLPNVDNPKKVEKNSYLTGLLKQLKMVIQISKVMPVHKVLWQFIKMAYLNKKYARR